jgi:prepilin-type N-terminal cleavage/methylation domain-containing protein
MRRGVTLIELIVTLVVASILSIGMFTAMKTVALQSQKAKARTIHSLDTQSALDQIAALLYHRIPATTIGYNGAAHRPLDNLGAIDDAHTLEWVGYFHEALLMEQMSGFVDMAGSNVGANRLSTPNMSINLLTSLGQKWPGMDITDTGIVFAGSFDQGGAQVGWHGDADRSDIEDVASIQNGSLNLATNPEWIYEKFYLADSGYAVARLGDVHDSNATCLQPLHVRDPSNTLVLFYGFRPWDGETFCADNNGAPEGNATILAENISAFRAEMVGYTIRLSIEARENVGGDIARPVRISKQKVVF